MLRTTLVHKRSKGEKMHNINITSIKWHNGFRLGLCAVFLLLSCKASVNPPAAQGNFNVFPTQDTELKSEHATLVIPAGTFSKDLQIDLSESDVDAAATSGLTPLSTRITLKFSEPVLAEAASQMILRVRFGDGQLDAAFANGKALAAYVENEGSSLQLHQELDDGKAGKAWLLPASTSEDAKELIIGLMGGSETLKITAVAVNAVVAYANSPAQNLVRLALAPHLPAPEIDGAGQIQDVPLKQNQWLVVCFTDGLSDVGTCDVNNPASAINRTREILSTDEDSLAQIGFSALRTATSTLRALRRGNFVKTEPAAAQLDATYNVAAISNIHACPKDLACFSFASGHMVLTEKIFLAASPTLMEGATLHEMAHAVQASIFMPLFSPPDRQNYNWLLEASADAVANWGLVDGNADQLAGKQSSGVWRDWRVPLGMTGVPPTIQYQSSEYFTLVNAGSLSYLPTLFKKISLAPGGSPYSRLLPFMTDLTGINFERGFIERVISKRGYYSVDKANCEEVALGDAETKDHIVFSAPMSSYCIHVTSNGNDEVAVNISEGSVKPGVLALMINYPAMVIRENEDGPPTKDYQYYFDATPVSSGTNEVAVQLIDVDPDRNMGNLVRGVLLHISKKRFPCQPARILWYHEVDCHLHTNTWSSYLQVESPHCTGKNAYLNGASCNDRGCRTFRGGRAAPLQETAECQADLVLLKNYNLPAGPLVFSHSTPDGCVTTDTWELPINDIDDKGCFGERNFCSAAFPIMAKMEDGTCSNVNPMSF